MNPKANAMVVATDPNNRGIDMGDGGGVWALREFVGDAELSRLRGLSREAFIDELTARYPDVSWRSHYGKIRGRTRDLQEAYGGLLAKSRGYDAIHMLDPDPKRSEFIVLNPDILRTPQAPVSPGSTPAPPVAVPLAPNETLERMPLDDIEAAAARAGVGKVPMGDARAARLRGAPAGTGGPIRLVKREDGSLVLEDGRRRLALAKERGAVDAEVIVRDARKPGAPDPLAQEFTPYQPAKPLPTAPAPTAQALAGARGAERRIPYIPRGSALEKRLDELLTSSTARRAIERQIVPEPFVAAKIDVNTKRLIDKVADADANAVRQQIQQYIARAKGGKAPAPTVTGQTGLALPSGPPRPPAAAQAAPTAPPAVGWPPAPGPPPKTLPGRLQALADEIVADHARMAKEEMKVGVLTGTRDNYLWHIFEFESDKLTAGLPGRGGGKFGFLSKRKDLRTILEIEAKGDRKIEGDLHKIWLARRIAHTRLMHRVELVNRFKKYLGVEFDFAVAKTGTGASQKVTLRLKPDSFRHVGLGKLPPAELRQHIVDTLETFMDPEKTSAFAHWVFDVPNAIVKPWMTSMRAGYSALNFGTNKINRWIGEATNPVADGIAGLTMLVDMKLPVNVTESALAKKISNTLGNRVAGIAESMKLVDVRLPANVSDALGNRVVTNPVTGQRLTVRQIKRELEKRDTYSHGIFAAELREHAEKAEFEGLGAKARRRFAEKVGPAGRKARLTDVGHAFAGAIAGGTAGGPVGAVIGATAGTAAVRVGRVISGSIEDMDRAAVVLDGWLKGLSWDDAAARMKRILFDYKSGSPFERDYARRIFLFYKWLRENIPYQLKSLYRRPASMGLLGKVQRQVTATTAPTEGPPDERFMEPWQKALVLARTGGKSKEGSPLYLNLRMHPGADLNGSGIAELTMGASAKESLQNVAALLSPGLQVPLKTLAGVSNFMTGQAQKEGVAGEWEPAMGKNAITLAQALARVNPDWGPDEATPNPLEPDRKVVMVPTVVNRTIELLGALAEYDRAFPQRATESTAEKTPFGQFLQPYNPLKGSQRRAYEERREAGGARELLEKKGTLPKGP